MDWPELRALIDAGDLPTIVRAVGGLTEEQRRPLARPLKEYSSWLRAAGSNPDSAVLNWGDRLTAAAAACAACLSTAAALAPELTWMSLFRYSEDKADPVAAASGLLRTRDVPWLPDLARRLADRLPAGDDNRAWGSANIWQLTDELVTATGIELPLTDGFVHCWAAHFMFRPDDDVAEAIRRDPRLIALVPRLFEVDGLGIPVLPLAMLADEGVLDRAVLIDGCLARLERGGRAGHLENVTVLHGLLAPGLDEVAERTRDYVALLPAAHRMAAELGQRELRRLDDAGRLEFGTFLQISEIVLFRREHKLIRAQLDWLDAAAGRDPRRVGDVLRAIALAFGQESAELQRRALTVARRHARHADDATRAELAQAAVVLRRELRERAVRAFGEPAGAGPVAGEPPHAPPLTVPAAVPRELPRPIGSPGELAEEFATLYESLHDGADPVRLERVLAALVTFSCEDRLRDMRDAWPDTRISWPCDYRLWSGHPDWSVIEDHMRRAGATTPLSASISEETELSSIVASALTGKPQPSGSPFPASVPGESTWRRLLDERLLAGPRRAMLLRLHEVSIGVCYAPRPLLMATPSSTSGLLDPGELLVRLERAAAEGWEPWALDMEQALLRLPSDAGGDVARRARRLGTQAAARLAAWLDGGGLAPPEVTHAMAGVPVWDKKTCAMIPLPRVVATVRPGAAIPRGSVGPMTALLTESPEPRHLFGQEASEAVWHESMPGAWLSCWPAMLPAHPDVIAAHLVPLFVKSSMFSWSPAVGRPFDPVVLPLLAEAGGAGGSPAPGLWLALGYGLAAREQSTRAAAVRALIILAGRGELDGATLGHDIGDLAARGDVLLTGVVPALRDAREAGAGRQVWALIAAALPRLLPPAVARPPQRLADLIALGADVAEQIRPGGMIPGLASVAGRADSARYVVESRRLLTILGRP